MSEYIITDEQLQKDHKQFYEAGQRNRQVWTARVYHGQEIVRCMDCKHYRQHEFILITDVDDVCLFWAEGVKVKPDGFCAWGARKEVNNDNQ